jgi:hypothetical protein
MQIISLVLSFLLLGNAEQQLSTDQLSDLKDDIFSQNAFLIDDKVLNPALFPSPFSNEHIEKLCRGRQVESPSGTMIFTGCVLDGVSNNPGCNDARIIYLHSNQ